MNRFFVVLLLCVSAAVASGCEGVDVSGGQPMAACAAYATQLDAQVAWENAGRPASRDGDGDDKVCESLPAGDVTATGGAAVDIPGGGGAGGAGRTDDPPSCKTTDKVVEIGLSKTKHANVLAHAADAGKRGYGKVKSDSPYPVWTINRGGAAGRRKQLLAGIPTRPGMDRDEAPPAMARDKVDASVRYVPSSENRSAGATMGVKLRQWCNGTKFRYIGY
jgi:hypothetical protein